MDYKKARKRLHSLTELFTQEKEPTNEQQDAAIAEAINLGGEVLIDIAESLDKIVARVGK